MLEIAMAEWRVPPHVVVSEWSDELLNLMVDKICARKKREREMQERAREEAENESPVHSFNGLG